MSDDELSSAKLDGHNPKKRGEVAKGEGAEETSAET